jgi:hypothetical protein
MRHAETLFNASIYTFVFRPSAVWFLTTNDPLYTTDHLHQRMVERAARSYRSLSEAQDHLSVLWPSLVELGQQRRRQGRRANVTDFVTPWADGLMFGNMEKLDGPVDLFAPTIIDFSNWTGIKRDLKDFYSSQKGTHVSLLPPSWGTHPACCLTRQSARENQGTRRSFV